MEQLEFDFASTDCVMLEVAKLRLALQDILDVYPDTSAAGPAMQAIARKALGIDGDNVTAG